MTISGEILTRFNTLESELLRTRNMINLNSTNINFNSTNINFNQQNINNNHLLIADLSNAITQNNVSFHTENLYVDGPLDVVGDVGIIGDVNVGGHILLGGDVSMIGKVDIK